MNKTRSNKPNLITGLLLYAALTLPIIAVSAFGGLKYRREAQRFDYVLRNPESYPVSSRAIEGMEQNRNFFNNYAYGLFGFSALYTCLLVYLTQDEIRNRRISKRLQKREEQSSAKQPLEEQV